MRRPVELIVKYRASVGLLCLIAVLIVARPNARSIFIGFLFILLGVFFRAWAAGYIDKNRELATEGPYALTRNPLYFGNFVLGLGIAIASNHRVGYLIFLVFFVSFFTFLILLERKRMKAKFGPVYEEWAKTTGLFFPRIRRIKKFDFNISYYMKNREYRVLYFSLFVIAVLIVKFLLGFHA